MTLAKGLSSGYLPISAVALNKGMAEVLIEGGEIHHGYTYSGHPVACAVAVANINYIQSHDLVERVRETTGPYLMAGLRQLAGRHRLIGEVRGRGLIAAIQLVRDKDQKILFSDEDEVGTKCRNHCFENNLIMRAVDQSMVMSPPLTISESEIDELLEKAEHCLDLTASEFGLS
ncbi:MAG: aminotransferase class III-fold pyridoxal phosphate-dependent enzyme, partial [Sphingomonadales bacterium]